MSPDLRLSEWVRGVPAAGRTCERRSFVTFSMMLDRARVPLAVGVVAASALSLGGCTSSPTYGTGKTSNQQLVEDLSGILSLGPKEQPKIDYKPRPELVKPETTAVLPPPQDNVTTASSAAWPESPEQRLARIRADATANQDNAFFRPQVQVDRVEGSPSARPLEGPDADPLARKPNPAQQRAEFKRALAENNGAVAQRRYLSDPPLVYREPAATAPVNDIGEDEWKKERAAQRASTSGKKRSWWPF